MDYYKDNYSCFGGIYTLEEIELNKRLYEECSKDILDCAQIESLLRQGADPLGATAVSNCDLLNHVYGEILCDLQESDSMNLPLITKLFLKHGMDIDNPRIPYDNDESINPMWDFAFAINENSIQALEMLLCSGLSADSVALMWTHATSDLIHIECGDPCNDKFWNHECTWLMKAIMLCASYDHILNEDEHLRDFIGYGYNSYDIHKFRKWNDFYYEFDTSRCTGEPAFCKSVVRIYEVSSKKEVWKIGICLKEGEF